MCVRVEMINATMSRLRPELVLTLGPASTGMQEAYSGADTGNIYGRNRDVSDAWQHIYFINILSYWRLASAYFDC